MNTLLQFAQSSMEYTTTSTQITSEQAAAVIAATGIGLMVGFILLVITYVVGAIFLGKIYKKAGVESWIAWVPIYNSWKMLEMGGQKGFWAVLAIVPFVQYVSIVFVLIAMYHITLKFGKSGSFFVLGLFLPLVWMIWLAIDESRWNNALGAPSLAVEHQGAAPVAAAPTTTPPTPPTV